MKKEEKKQSRRIRKWKKLTPAILRSYGGKFSNISEKKAWKYIKKIEQYCLHVCKQYIRLSQQKNE